MLCFIHDILYTVVCNSSCGRNRYVHHYRRAVRFLPFLIAIIFFNSPFYAKDFVEVDVTRVSFEFSDLESSVRENVEADSFWCMTKVLDGIQDNYTFAQPGIQVKIRQLEELLKRVDVKLHNHIVFHDVQYLQFSFR